MADVGLRTLRPSDRKGINLVKDLLCSKSEVTWIDVVASLAGRQFHHRSQEEIQFHLP